MPYTEQSLPFSGSTAMSRHASFTGAQAAARSRREKTLRYVDLLKSQGPLTDQDAAAMLGWPLSSINSIRNGLSMVNLIEARGYETQVCGSRSTRRTRWAWRG